MILRLEGLLILILSYFSTLCRADTVAIDDQDPSVSYVGQWSHWKRGDADTSEIEQVIGAPLPSNVNTLSFTNAPSSPAAIIFQGTSISIIALKIELGGTISVTLDGAPMGTVDLSGTSNAVETVWTSPQLPNGQHSLSVAKMSPSAPNSQGSYVNINYFSVEQPSTAPNALPPSNSNPAANSQPLPSAAGTTAHQQPSIASDAPPIHSSSSPSLSAPNRPLSPSSSLSGNAPSISNGQVTSTGNVQQNTTTTYNSLDNTSTAYITSPSPTSTSNMKAKFPLSKLLGAAAGIIILISFGTVTLLLRRSRRRKVVRLEEKTSDGETEPIVAYTAAKNEVFAQLQADEKLRLPSRLGLGLPTTIPEAMAAHPTTITSTTGTTRINNESNKVHREQHSSFSAYANATRRAEKALHFLRITKLKRKENPCQMTVTNLDSSAGTINEELRNSRTSESPPVTNARHIGMLPLVEVEQLRTQMVAMQATIETQARHLFFLEHIAEHGRRGESDGGTECLPPYASN